MDDDHFSLHPKIWRKKKEKEKEKILEKTLGDQTLNPKPKAEELRTLKP